MQQPKVKLFMARKAEMFGKMLRTGRATAEQLF
jgi:dsDNA-binding SOS-regulon protein